MTMKARRVYMGEDLPAVKNVQIQVGSPAKTTARVDVNKCASCHQGSTSLTSVLHANGNMSTCNACHVSLANELSNQLYARIHVIHSRSDRYDAPLNDCSACHNDASSIQRTSKSACMSCHSTYSQWHVNQFGALTSPFFGGGPEALNQCSNTCHTSHPGGGFGGCDH
jgi:hypothetical protein